MLSHHCELESCLKFNFSHIMKWLILSKGFWQGTHPYHLGNGDKMWISFCPRVNVGFLCFIFMKLSSLPLLPSTCVRFYVFLIRGMFFIVKIICLLERNSGMEKGEEAPRFCQERLEDTYFHCLIYKYIFWNLIFRGVTYINLECPIVL